MDSERNEPLEKTSGTTAGAAEHRRPTVTLGELTALAGRQVVLDEGELIERLRLLSAADCMAVIAELSARIAVASNPYVPEVQRQLARRIGGQSGLTEALDLLLKRGRATVVVCEQQLVHLARLVILHAELRL